MTVTFTPRGLLSLLFNGEKAMDVCRTALALGVLDHDRVTLGRLSEELGLVPLRLYKFMDCLESIGLVTRTASATSLLDTVYMVVPGARDAVHAVVGPASIELDRDRYPWRLVADRLDDVLSGELSIPPDRFDWPPVTHDQTSSFEQSMVAGLLPFTEAFCAARELFTGRRLLDIGGGDGSLAISLLDRAGLAHADVFNLPVVEPVFRAARDRSAYAAGDRLGFVAGDFFRDPLPSGYDVVSFVRVLHDWPFEAARELLAKARASLQPGGRIVISEEFRTADRLCAQFFWSYFLMGVDSCQSQLREAELYIDELARLGFDEIELREGPMPMITAVG